MQFLQPLNKRIEYSINETALRDTGENVIYPVKPKLWVVALGSLLCGLVVGGCSNSDSNSRRFGLRRSQRMLPLPPGPPGLPQNAFIPNFKPASPADVRVAKELIRNHLHAFGRNDFRTASNLLTSQYHRSAQGEENHLRFTVTTYYSDFMQVKKVRWNRFVKDAQSHTINVKLEIEARNGSKTRVDYRLLLEDGRYRVAGISSPPSSRSRFGPDARSSPQEQMEEKMFSGVLYSPSPRHRVLDAPPISL